MKKTITASKTKTTMRSLFNGSRESGVVRTIAAIKLRMAYFFRPIIIHEIGGVKDNSGK